MRPWVKAQVPTARARVLVLVGVLVGLASSGMWTLFVAAEILSDPGGAVAIAWIAVWFVPTLVVSAMTFFWPRVSRVVLLVLMAAYLLGIVAMIVWAQRWYEIENTLGPVQLVVALALSVPLLLLGLTHARAAGWLLIILVAAPLIAGLAAFAGVRVMGGAIAMVVVGAPLIASGVLYLVAHRVDARASMIRDEGRGESAGGTAQPIPR